MSPRDRDGSPPKSGRRVVDDPLNRGQTDACAWKFLLAAQALESAEQLCGVFHIESRSVIFHKEDLSVSFRFLILILALWCVLRFCCWRNAGGQPRWPMYLRTLSFGLSPVRVRVQAHAARWSRREAFRRFR